MKAFIVLAVCLVAARAAPNGFASSNLRMPAFEERHGPSTAHPIIPIVRMVHDNDNNGAYNLDFQSGDGSQVQQHGNLRDLGDKEGPVSVKHGSYSYPGTDGKTYTVNWTADENGFHATGEHLPVAAPIPDEILRSIDLASLPQDHHLVLERTGPLLRVAAPLMRAGY